MPASPWVWGAPGVTVEGVGDWLGAVRATPIVGGRALADIPQQRAELAFDLRIEDFALPSLEGLIREAGDPMPSLPPQHLTGFLRGFIDVVLAVERRYYVVDYRSAAGLHREAYDEARASGGHGKPSLRLSVPYLRRRPATATAPAPWPEGKRPLAAFAISFCGAWTPIPSWAFLLTILILRSSTR